MEDGVVGVADAAELAYVHPEDHEAHERVRAQDDPDEHGEVQQVWQRLGHRAGHDAQVRLEVHQLEDAQQEDDDVRAAERQVHLPTGAACCSECHYDLSVIMTRVLSSLGVSL